MISLLHGFAHVDIANKQLSANTLYKCYGLYSQFGGVYRLTFFVTSVLLIDNKYKLIKGRSFMPVCEKQRGAQHRMYREL